VIRHILRARLAAAIRAAAVFGFPVAVTAAPAEIVVVIDDLGFRDAEGQRAIALPGAVTLAILPHTRFLAPLWHAPCMPAAFCATRRPPSRRGMAADWHLWRAIR